MEEGMKCEGQCINLEGSFKCECTSPGLKLSWDGVSCSGELFFLEIVILRQNTFKTCNSSIL